eukprot:Amastigsp_a676629_98.p4 type:complete len:101 gc:universal Amastigsp_a676629_98:319-17(-)
MVGEDLLHGIVVFVESVNVVRVASVHLAWALGNLGQDLKGSERHSCARGLAQDLIAHDRPGGERLARQHREQVGCRHTFRDAVESSEHKRNARRVGRHVK